MTETKSESVTRSMTVEIFVPKRETPDGPETDWGLVNKIIAAIRRYRFAAHKLYAAIMLGQVAGAKIEDNGDDDTADVRLTPVTKAGVVALATALNAATVEGGKKTKGQGQTFAVQTSAGLGYSLRDWFRKELYPGSLSFVWDSARRDALDVWTSKDPEFPKATRGYLALQGVRGIARFMFRGIGFPAATGRPKLVRNTLGLKWDHEIGPVVFALEKLDYGRWSVWEHLRDETPGWTLGTVYLTTRRGRKNPAGKREGPKLYAVVTYQKPADLADVDPDRVCRVAFGDTQVGWLSVRGPNPQTEHDSVDGFAVVGFLAMMRKRREAIEARRGSSGSPRKPWGHRHQYQDDTEVLTALTARRERRCRDFNHAWTRRIHDRAVAWRCGRVVLEPPPADVFGFDWRWSDFKRDLTYKCEQRGIALTIEVPERPPGQ